MKPINRQTLREYWNRFKQWQKNPLPYEFESTEVNHCANCEHDYTGNYCPYCSQKHGVGRINWHSVREGIMEVWGLQSRSMPYSLLQLLFRPGYFISEYINGKRQVSFPPVKMLVIISALSVLIDFLTIKSHFKEKTTAVLTQGRLEFIDTFLSWFQSHPGWGWLMANSLLLIPTWLLFRHSPRNTRHVLPQGFFILVFLSVQVLIYDNIADCTYSFFYFIIPLCYLLTFKQLFNYNWWGTIWRTLIVFISGLLMLLSLTIAYDIAHTNTPDITTNDRAALAFVLCANLVILAIGVFIDWLRAKKQPAHET